MATERTGFTPRLANLLRFCLIWAFSLTCLLGSMVPVFGQFGGDDEGLNEGPSQILMLAPREFQQQLKQAEKSIADGQFSDAIEILDRFLRPPVGPETEESQQEDYFLGRAGEAQLRGSLRSEARQLLGRLPAAGREIYRLQYGAEASRLLEQALRQHDVDSLALLTRQYFHTPAGLQATYLLGQHHLDLGQGLAASIYFSRLLEDEEARSQFDPQLSLQLARSWILAGQPSRAETTLTDLKQRQPNAEWVVAGQPVTVFGPAESPLDWLQRVAPSHSGSVSRPIDEWTLHRGVPSRNPLTQGGRLLPRLRWRVPVANDPDDEEMLQELAREYREESAAPMATISPLVIGDVVLLRTAQHLLAVDFVTGKRVWEFPWADDVSTPGGSASRIPARRDVHRAQLEERLWFDSIYGQLASDGQSVFLLDELPLVTTEGGQMLTNGLRNLGVDLSERLRSFNYLVALELRSQGKYRWRVGGPSGEDEARLANAFFLGAPLVLGKELYVMAEIRGDISLYVLSAETGKYLWSQQLAHVGISDIQMDNLRRLAGATPSYADGVLLCPTSAGAVVAVDIANRSLLWGHQYPRNVVGNVRNPRLNQFYALSQQFTRDRWSDASAIIGHGRVLVTPIEADQLLCLDLLTGQLLWSFGRESEWLQVAGIHENHAIVVGKSKVAAFVLDTGAKAWELPLGPNEEQVAATPLPSGRGFITGDSFFLPVHDRVIQIDLKNGQRLGETVMQEPLGHLICHRDEVLSITPSALTVFHQQERLAARVAERLAAQPNDPWALEHAGILKLHEGDLTSALAALQQAYQAYSPQDDRRQGTKQLLVETLLDQMERTDETAPERLLEIDQMIDRPAQRERYLRLVGQQWLRQGEAVKSFEAFLELAAIPATASSLTHFEEPQQPLQTMGPGYAVRRDRLIRRGIEAAWNAASTEQRAEMEATIVRAANQVLQGQSIQALRDHLALFADQPSANQVRLHLASRYLETRDWIFAEQTLLPILEKETSQETPRAWYLLSRVMQESQQWDAAAHCWRSLMDRWADHPIENGQTTRQLWEQATKQPQLLARYSGEPRWQYGRVHVEHKNVTPANLSTQFQTNANYRSVRWLESTGPLGTRLRVVHDSSGANHLVVQDAFGNPRLMIPSSLARGVNRYRDGTMSYKNSEHLVVVNQGHTLVAIDALAPDATAEERILWPANYREILGSTVASLRPNFRVPTPKMNLWGQVVQETPGAIGPVTSEGTVFVQSSSLHCVDTLTGDKLWSRPLNVVDPIIWGDEEIVLVASRTGNEATIYRMLDGAELARRPLPDAERRWSTFGRWLLTWDEQLDQGQALWRLRLWDPWTNQERWARSYPTVSKGQVQPDGTLTIIEASGHLTILDGLTGKLLVEDQLEPSDRKLLAVYLMSSKDQWIVVRGFEPKAARGTRVNSPEPLTVPLIDGDVYAYLRSSGQRQWQVPAIVESYGLHLDQPEELPILIFQRETSPATRQGRRQAQEMGILCIDRRDGRLVFEADRLNFTYASFFLGGNPDDQTVSLRVSNQHQYLIRFTNEPQPPAPPAQTGAAASRGKGTVLSKIGAALNAMGRGVAGPLRASENEETDEADSPAAPPPDPADNQAQEDALEGLLEEEDDEDGE